MTNVKESEKRRENLYIWDKNHVIKKSDNEINPTEHTQPISVCK